MAIRGVPLNKTKQNIIDALKECKGVVTHAANKLKITRQCIYNIIKENEDMKPLLAEMREEYEEELLDAAEDVITYALNNKENDLTNAMKAAYFALNNKGSKRNWGKFKPDEDVRAYVQDNISGQIQVLYTEIKDK